MSRYADTTRISATEEQHAAAKHHHILLGISMAVFKTEKSWLNHGDLSHHGKEYKQRLQSPRNIEGAKFRVIINRLKIMALIRNEPGMIQGGSP